MCLLILCEVFFCPVVIIFLYLFLSYHLQMAGGYAVMIVLLEYSHSHHVVEGT